MSEEKSQEVRSMTAAQAKSGVGAPAGRPLVLILEDTHGAPPLSGGDARGASRDDPSDAAGSGDRMPVVSSGIARVQKLQQVTLRIAAPACVGTALVVLDEKGAALDLSAAARRACPC